MYKSAIARADEQFAAAQKKAKRLLSEQEQAAADRAERTARLKALRLAKEAAEKESAGKAE